MSRYVLMPEDAGSESMQITIPNALVTKVSRKRSKKAVTKTATAKNIRKVICRLNKNNVSVDEMRHPVHNGHVLKNINFDKAVNYAARGIRKRKYFEFNKLL